MENRIRYAAVGGAGPLWEAGGWRRERVPPRGWAVVTAGALVVTVAIAGLAGVGVSDNSNAIGAEPVAKTITAKNVKRAPLATSCEAVVHIGDSTSEGLVSSEYLPDPKQQISAQYARVGATTQHFEIAAARSIAYNS